MLVKGAKGGCLRGHSDAGNGRRLGNKENDNKENKEFIFQGI